MINNLIIFLVSILFLLSLNKFLQKYNFCIDRASISEQHKLLLQFNDNTPLSGSFYFLIVIFILNYFYNLNFLYICLPFFLIGILSDLKFTDSPKLRLFIQFISLLIFLYLNSDFIIDIRINYLNSLLEIDFLRVLFISFFF